MREWKKITPASSYQSVGEDSEESSGMQGLHSAFVEFLYGL